MDAEALKAELLQLSIARHSGDATDDELARLERLLHDDTEARSLYLRISDDTVTLSDAGSSGPNPAVGVSDFLSDTKRPGGVLGRSWILLLATAAAALLVVSGGLIAWNKDEPQLALDTGDKQAAFARIVNLRNVGWGEGSRVYREWQRLGRGDSFKIDTGLVEILYDSGVQFLAQGPAELTFASESRVVASQGKLVARVSPDAIGFEVTTPQAKVIDRGTSFGVSVRKGEKTDVVVYDGLVDLEFGKDAAHKGPRMAAGDALRILRDGKFERIASVGDDLFLPPPGPRDGAPDGEGLIAAVSDNLKSSQTSKCYRVIREGFGEDCPAFVDRLHQWNGLDGGGLPSFLKGCDYVMTFNDDKVSTGIRLSVTLNRPARLYILIDDRVDPVPQWLINDFVDTGWDVGVDEGYVGIETHKQIEVGPGAGIESVCSVWARDVAGPGPIQLGGPRDPEAEPQPYKGKEKTVGMLMYGVVAGELPGSARGLKAP